MDRIVTLRGHYDGENIQLDEPFELQANVRLLITVLPDEFDQADRDAWTAVSRQSLSRAYSPDEPEYTAAAIQEPNPEYDAGS